MGLISVTNPNDGETADAADVANPINTIVTEINGRLDSNNISSLSGSKISAGTLSNSALDSTSAGGWTSLSVTPNTITCNGNRSYSMVFNSTDLTSTLSPGMRLKMTRSVTAPTQCTSLNGTTQYYNKTSPAATTFTDDFVAMAYVKLTSYQAGAIISRYNGTSGWSLEVNATGQVIFIGYNAGAANFSQILSNQSIPLNRWVHISAQLDMSSFTNSATTSYIMFDGVDVPGTVTRGGTNPTALVQAGDLTIGAKNAASFFAGKIAQAALFNAKVTQATIRGYIGQTLAGTETSLISAYSFNNSINDLNANANNLTANGSAVATNADSPFSVNSFGTALGTIDYGIITSSTFSTNTTIVVQVPEANAIPTSGGLSAVAYSTWKSPYGFPAQRGKWVVTTLNFTSATQAAAVTGTWYNLGSIQINIPVGEWVASYQAVANIVATTASYQGATLSTANNTESNKEFSTIAAQNATNTQLEMPVYRARPVSLSSATVHYLNAKSYGGTSVTLGFDGTVGATIVEAELAQL